MRARWEGGPDYGTLPEKEGVRARMKGHTDMYQTGAREIDRVV
jgi:hypothetical protein